MSVMGTHNSRRDPEGLRLEEEGWDRHRSGLDDSEGESEKDLFQTPLKVHIKHIRPRETIEIGWLVPLAGGPQRKGQDEDDPRDRRPGRRKPGTELGCRVPVFPASALGESSVLPQAWTRVRGERSDMSRPMASAPQGT